MHTLGLENETTYPQLTGSREILPIFVEAYSHHTIRSVKRLFHSISMMYINIDVQNPIVIPGEDQKDTNEKGTPAYRKSSKMPKTISENE